jgi:hypothetical protein
MGFRAGYNPQLINRAIQFRFAQSVSSISEMLSTSKLPFMLTSSNPLRVSLQHTTLHLNVPKTLCARTGIMQRHFNIASQQTRIFPNPLERKLH